MGDAFCTTRDASSLFIAMYPTLDLFFVELPAYTVFVMLGITGGLFAAYLYLRVRYRRAAMPANLFDSALVVLLAGWVGARSYHVATHWDYYSMRPDEIAQFGVGGLAMRGALITGVMALAFYARVRGLRFARLADAGAVGVCLGQAIGWVGALAHGANYGVVSASPIALDLPDIYGIYALRFPVQHLEILLFAGLFLGLGMLAFRKPQAGLLASAYLFVSSLANFLLGFQRGDDAVFVQGLRLDQWIDALFVLIALVFYLDWAREGKVGINQ